MNNNRRHAQSEQGSSVFWKVLITLLLFATFALSIALVVLVATDMGKSVRCKNIRDANAGNGNGPEDNCGNCALRDRLANISALISACCADVIARITALTSQEMAHYNSLYALLNSVSSGVNALLMWVSSQPPSCEGEVSAALGAVTLNVVSRRELGIGFPPDTIVAIGNNDDDGRIITAVNNYVTILNKATHTRISNTRDFYGTTGVSGGDPWVTWDATTNRFFLTAFVVLQCRYGLTAYSPPAVVQNPCLGTATFGPQTYSVNGLTQVGSPLDGCTAMAPLTGKIAVIIRGTCTFTAKVKNAQNAGAIAVVVYNNAGEAIRMGGTDNTIIIPSVMVSTTYGTLLVANSPANITISSAGITTASTTMYISVSNTSHPNTRADFAHYTVSDAPYANLFADYPKHATSADALYITVQDFGNYSAGEIQPCMGAGIRAFNKAHLLNGVGATTLWSVTIPGMGVTGPQMVFPAETRTPITDQTLPTIFVGLNTGSADGYCTRPSFAQLPLTALHIYGARASGLLPYVGVVPLPTPMTAGNCLPSWSIGIGNCVYTPLARQPPPAVPAGLDNLLNFMMTGVVFKGHLYTAFVHNISNVHSVIRWFEIDIAPVALEQQPTLVQWGDLNVDPNLDTFMPHIDVTEDGTMGIAFYTSGPTKHVVAQYTFRLASDPPNTIRTPFHTAVPNNYTFYNGGVSWTRYGDYIGFQVDPVDRQTFYGFTQRPDPLGPFIPPGPCINTSACIAEYWTTDLFKFRVDANTCPTDGISTSPIVLSSTSPNVHQASAAKTNFIALDSFNAESAEDEDCYENDDDVEVCYK